MIPTIPTAAVGLPRRRWRALAGPFLAAGGAAVAAGAVAVRGPHVPGLMCPSRALTGLDCPGCGATRSVAALAGGDLAGAFEHHLLVPVALVALGWAWLAWVAAAWWQRPVSHPLRSRWAATATLAVVAAFTVVRNLGSVAGGFLGSGGPLG